MLRNFKKMNRQEIISFVNKNRIYFLFVLVFLVMSIFAPRFFNFFNLTTIMSTLSMNAMLGIGFTVVMICGQLDLSVGTVITLAGVVTLSLKPALGFGLSMLVALLIAAAVGFINGIIVVKAKVNSFIITLGMMTVLQGVIYTATGGNTVGLSTPDAFALSDFLGASVLPLLTPRVIITLALVVVCSILLKNTRTGRNFYMLGGNKQTAWLAGIDTDKYTVAAFMLCSVSAALGGSLFAMESLAATLNLGDSSLMYVVSAAIIGGTAMSGGKGGIFTTFMSILTLEVLYNGVVLFGLGNEIKILLAGLILASVVIYEAYSNYSKEKVLGQRPGLMLELVDGKLPRP